MFRKMPFILAAVIGLITLLYPFIPLVIKEGLYAISLSIKEIIVLFLPFIIFGLLFKAAVTLANNATKIILMILVLLCCSNFISTFLSHYVGAWIYNFDLSLVSPQKIIELKPLWSWKAPTLVENYIPMLAGIILGILSSLLFPTQAQKIATKIDEYVHLVLQGIVYVIPFFVAGFVINLEYDGIVNIILKDYSIVFAIIALAQFSYILFVYFLLNNANGKEFIASIKNMFPAAVSGFSTMSSAASMPLTIIGTEKNLKNKDLDYSVIPTTVNIHLVGDCFAIPILAYAILKSFGMAEPTLLSYTIFALYFIIAKFSVAAVPGGGILVMLPILHTYLNFNAEMMSLITALYVLFDPVITCANVLGNGAFAKFIDYCNSKT
jgi:Na+/H+-dicarboxylate symporter